MDLIQKFINELQTTGCSFVPSSIKEVNGLVLNKLYQIVNLFKLGNNKYQILSAMVKIGLELENTFQINKINNDIISQQLSFYTNLAKPIINKIRDICLELNLELVADLKNTIYNLINDNQDKYSLSDKYIKFMQINSFCRNINYVIKKEVMFEDFGITIRISNPHHKYIFKDLINEIKLLSPNNNKDKRFDWYWKASDSNIDIDINILSTYIEKQENNINNINIYMNTNNNFCDENNFNDNDDKENNNFKIIQTQPENISQIYNMELNNQYDITKPSIEQISKIISNSIIIEDDSFTIPIDNIDNTDNTDNSTIMTNFTS